MWRDAAWLYDMLNAGRIALEYVRDIQREAFLQDLKLQDAVIMRLMIVGEASKNVSMEFRASHPEVPWKEIAGFRDILVHQYFRVDKMRVWQILQQDVPAMIKYIEPLVPPIDESPRDSE
jgi:uncharacterized protein with HEPN domain